MSEATASSSEGKYQFWLTKVWVFYKSVSFEYGGGNTSLEIFSGIVFNKYFQLEASSDGLLEKDTKLKVQNLKRNSSIWAKPTYQHNR